VLILEVEQPLAHLISSHDFGRLRFQIAIQKFHGDDLDTLQRTAEQVKATIQDVPGITPPVGRADSGDGELHIELRAERPGAAWIGDS